MRTSYRQIAAGLLLMLALFVFSMLRGLSVEEILTYTPTNPLLAVFVLAMLYILKSAVCAIPMTVLYMCAGILFSPMVAIFTTYLGLTLEITAGYWIGRCIGGERTLMLVGKSEKAAKWIRSLDRHRNLTVCVVRMLPGPLPFDMMSWLFGASDLHFSHYLFYSLLGVSPAMLPWVLAGDAVADPLSKRFLLPFVLGVAIALTTLFLLRRLERHRLPQHS